ncbi:galactose oxidase-like domain-containing protein [Nitrosomonas sp.]|uniref:galactose oxidase-like domain-containing protein n=1 Tax=Nitrosomonas sp. TaxID=42353 RepID=UPI002083891C|nr:galactose oxidase-like domain-containing protein [Nitrosomonas sp.]GJL75335.1 MAG: hypothetical protein NMNS02_14410 [Nitrosomonas sp.]
MIERNIYLKIEQIEDYSPVEPDEKAPPPIEYRRDCMRGEGHLDGTIPASEVKARSLTALTYREYLDSGYVLPKVDKIIRNDINEPVYDHRVPGTVIYTHPGEILKIHVWNCDKAPHAFHVHGLDYGIDSDGAYPFGVYAEDGRRSDEICPGDTWTYTFSVADDSVGAWPFHDHWRKVAVSVNRGLFGGIVVLPKGISPPGSFVIPPKLAALPEEALKQANRKKARLDALPENSRIHIENQLDFLKEWIESVLFSENNLAQNEEFVLELGRKLEEAENGCFSQSYISGIQAVDDSIKQFSSDAEIKSASVSEALLNNDAFSFRHLFPLFGPIHAPLFLHVMMNPDADPVFDSGDIEELVGVFEFTFNVAGDFDYFCQFHPIMTGTVHVAAGGPANVTVNIVDGPPMDFSPKEITVGVGGTVRWENHSVQHHTVTSVDGGAVQSHCLNGRAFSGNTPTILGFSGQRIRWYVFNLDFGHEFHNFHTHAMRWKFVDNENQDTRALSPAESFVVETKIPQVVLLTGKFKELQEKWPKPKNARLYLVKGDFVFHCHVHHHMMNGMIGIVRARQFLWLTEEMANELKKTTNLLPYNGTNACPDVDLQRCMKGGEGEWIEIPGAPEVTMMHSMPLPNTTKMLYWGYTNEDQSRIFDWATDTYSQPANQPADLPGHNLNSSNLWSGEHAFFDDASGTLIAHGGLTAGQQKSFLFDPTTETWSAVTDTADARFYSTTLTLADGKILTLYGSASKSIEVYDPAAGTWSAPLVMPPAMNHHVYYPWTFLQPDGKLFIAGPHDPSNRFDWNNAAATLETFPAINGNRSTGGEKGTAVMLMLRPPNYKPEVVIIGGNTPATEQTAEIIDLSQAAPVWQSLPNLNEPRPFQVNSILLPDGRVFVAGGVSNGLDGGPSEIYDPSNPGDGWKLGPTMQHTRGYHSSMVMMPDGSLVFGGDPQVGGVPTNHERFYPGYFEVVRPAISNSPAIINFGAGFTIDTPDAANISEVILMAAGAVTHGFNMTQRGVECVINGAGIASIDVIAPPNGNIAPPGWWILFILNANRIPSEGRWIRLSA